MFPQIINFFSWYLLVIFFGIIVAPLSFRLLKSLPDRGYTVIKPLGVLLIGYLHWLLTSLGILKNNMAGVCTAIAIVIVIIVWRTGKNGIFEFWKWVRENKKFVILSEIIFFAAFLIMAVIRAYNPDIWGTEKPMELMFINSISRSTNFPPQDAWLSGFSISYYYFGYVIVALFARLTNTFTGIAFNLGIALVFALAFSAAFGIVLNMIAVTRWKEKINSSILVSAILPALFGPVLVLTMGNFYGIMEVFNRNNILANLEIPAIHFEYGNPEPMNGLPSSGGIQRDNLNFWDWMDIKQLDRPDDSKPVSSDLSLPNWFFASRTIQDRNLVGTSQELIDEFPAFSFLLADLHPHVLALPFVLLAILVCFEWLLSGSVLDLSSKIGKRTYIEKIVLTALVFGSLIFLNTWDFPVYAFIFVLVVFSGIYPKIEKSNWHWIAGRIVRLLVIIFGLSILMFLPFILSLQTQAGGILPNLVYPTRFRQVFVMFGPVFLPILVFMIAYWIHHRGLFPTGKAVRLSAYFVLILFLFAVVLTITKLINDESSFIITSMVAPFNWRDGINLIIQRHLIQSITVVVAFVFLIISSGFLLLRKKEIQKPVIFGFIMVLTGTLLFIGPEFVYLRDQFGTRMNTVFKFYFQVWILWSLMAAYTSWLVISRLKKFGRWLFLVFLTIIFLSGLFYTYGTLMETTQRFTRQPTLDGLAYYANYYPDDWAAIEWVNANVADHDVVLEGTRGAYWIEGRSSRFSMMTGIPTVMGWVNHESQWRGPLFSLVANREGEINTIYVSRDWDTTVDLLDKYQVKYVVVSPLEWEWYGSIYLDKFDINMKRVFEFGEIIIYQR
jgi:YYY domain-containing protein